MKNECLLSSVLLFYILLPINLVAQAPDTIWTKTFGGSGHDYGYTIDKLSEAEFVLTGYTSSYGQGGKDVWLLKVDGQGDTMWTRTYGTDDDEYGYDACCAYDGGFLITGQRGLFPFECEVLTLKTDGEGNLEWMRTYGGDFAMVIRPVVDNYYMSLGCTPWEWYLIKFNSSGDTLWTRCYSDANSNYAYDMQEYYSQTDGGMHYLMVGCTGTGDYYHSLDVRFVNINGRGSVTASRRFGNPAFSYDDWASSVEPTSDGYYIVAASTKSFGEGGYDIWLMKINVERDTLWTRTYGGVNDDVAIHAIETEEAGYIVVGYTESFGHGGRDVYIIKTDFWGDTLWTKTIGGAQDEFGSKIVPVGKGEFIIIGYTESFGAGGRDLYLIKLGAEPVSISGLENKPTEISLSPNYPNPFNISTMIKYELPKQSQVTIDIYDILGRKVSTLEDAVEPAGYHHLIWNAEGLSSGVYFYKLQAGDNSETRKMMLVK